MNLLSPTNLKNAITFDKARELRRVVMTSEDPDEIGEAIEAAASDSDLAQSLIFWLVMEARGWDEQRSGVELVANAYGPESLWTP